MAIKSNDYQTGYSGVSATDVGSMIGVTPTVEEIVVLDKIIEYIEMYVCNYCNRQFESEVNVYSQEIVGTGTKYYLSAYPINEIETITYDGDVVYLKGDSDNQIELDKDFFVTDDYVLFENRLLGSYFYDDLYLFYNKKIVFENTISRFWGNDLVMAIEQLAGNQFQGRDTGNKDISSLSTGTYSVAFEGAVSGMVTATLNKYKKIMI